jgi:hypothetical protein
LPEKAQLNYRDPSQSGVVTDQVSLVSRRTQEGPEAMKKLGGSGLMVHKHAAALALVLLLGSPAFGKRKDDVVIMKNGVKFTWGD